MAIGLKATITPNAIPAAPGAGLKDRIRTRFRVDGGDLVVKSVQAVLGTSAVYTLSPEYAARKPAMKGYRRIAGKAADQPLILTADMYDHVEATPLGDGFQVGVEQGHGESPEGFDYSEHWEERTAFLGAGLDPVEDQLEEMLADAIVDIMGL